jgi:hypothetical protein
MKGFTYLPCAALFLGGLLTVIFVPLSFKYVEYDQYGLKQSYTGEVDTSTVYTSGRYPLGVSSNFVLYKADAHRAIFDDLSLFSAASGSGSSNSSSVGLEVLVDIDLTYLLKQEEIGNLHEALASSYPTVVNSRTKDGIKNVAIFITFEEYFKNRTLVEARFRRAVQDRWDAPPALPCVLDQFHLGRVKISETVAQRQMEARIQVERNDREDFLQQAQVEREVTSVTVNQIMLQEQTTLRTAEAEASLIRARATVEAKETLVEADTNGTQNLVTTLGFDTQESVIAQQYIQALMGNPNDVTVELSYLPAENVVKTQEV